jgi:RhtB (resistance to homoserine/threonine) family protein
MDIALGPFVAISILVIPGPDTAVLTKNALVGGRRGGVFTAFGVVTGLAVWTFAAALGIAALLSASAVAFNVLKIAGAVYLLWLGLQLLRERGALAAERANGRPAPRRVGRRAFRQGLFSNLGNPKIAVFFTSFLPQFVGDEGSALASLLVLGAVFCALGLVWLVAYGIAVGHGAGMLRRPAVRRALDRVTGVVLIALGIRLALEQR